MQTLAEVIEEGLEEAKKQKLKEEWVKYFLTGWIKCALVLEDIVDLKRRNNELP